MSICYVTAFLDIQRENWSTFSRTFDDYFKSFTPHIDMFRKLANSEKGSDLYHLAVFIDKKYSPRVREYTGELKNVTIIDIDEDYMQQNSTLWQRLPRETQIMQSYFYKGLVSHRPEFPENNNPRYTLINHAKIDFINLAMRLSIPSEFFCWVDFGYFSREENIPENPLDVKLFDKDRINYTLINPVTPEDSNTFYTLQNAPEKIGGFFFFGRRDVMAEYQNLYHTVHKVYQNIGIVDDDQHIALQCYFVNPTLFALHHAGGWHKALVFFQNSQKTDMLRVTGDSPTGDSLTEIMNRNGSDKGSGHHNYTAYYSKLFEPIRQEKLDLLEIGIGSVNPHIPSNMWGTPGGYTPGSSLRGWREYFPNSHIYGCDIDKSILFESPRITTFFVDQTSPQVLREQIGNKSQMYDIIVDDGLHYFPTNWVTLKEIFSKLKDNGYYIIEDICDFDHKVYTDPFLAEIEFKYIQIPNLKNSGDNNIVVARKKGKYILDL